MHSTHMEGRRKLTVVVPSSPSSLWVSRIELRSPVLAASTFTSGPISLAPQDWLLGAYENVSVCKLGPQGTCSCGCHRACGIDKFNTSMAQHEKCSPRLHPAWSPVALQVTSRVESCNSRGYIHGESVTLRVTYRGESCSSSNFHCPMLMAHTGLRN